MKVAVLIGAGANYGAGDVFSKRPPLGWELFPELARAFPATWGNIPDHSFDEGFEAGMARTWSTSTWARKVVHPEVADVLDRIVR